jgi:hypothetical protein
MLLLPGAQDFLVRTAPQVLTAFAMQPTRIDGLVAQEAAQGQPIAARARKYASTRASSGSGMARLSVDCRVTTPMGAT